MNIKVGTKVLSNDEVIDMPWHTEGVVKGVVPDRTPPLYEVYFGLGEIYYLYDNEFFVVED